MQLTAVLSSVPDVKVTVSEALARIQRMQLSTIHRFLPPLCVSEVLARIQRMQQRVYDLPDIRALGLRGTCAESKDATLNIREIANQWMQQAYCCLITGMWARQLLLFSPSPFVSVFLLFHLHLRTSFRA